VDWGDGTTDTVTLPVGQLDFAATHPYADNGSYDIKVTVTGPGGSDRADLPVTVSNVAPTAAIAGAPASSPEGAAIALRSAVTDPSSVDTAAGFTYAWSVTKNGSAFASGSAALFTFTPDDNGTYVVTLQATDKDGDTGTATQTITATNVSPAN